MTKRNFFVSNGRLRNLGRLKIEDYDRGLSFHLRSLHLSAVFCCSIAVFEVNCEKGKLRIEEIAGRSFVSKICDKN
jgi:hypothetical protein